jgi:hypothetical protein
MIEKGIGPWIQGTKNVNAKVKTVTSKRRLVGMKVMTRRPSVRGNHSPMLAHKPTPNIANITSFPMGV